MKMLLIYFAFRVIAGRWRLQGIIIIVIAFLNTKHWDVYKTSHKWMLDNMFIGMIMFRKEQREPENNIV